MTRFLFVFLLFSLSFVFVNGVFAAESLPWGVQRIGGDIVWDMYPGDLAVDPGLPAGQNIRVAVLDTGVDYNHPDLVGRVVGGTSYIGQDPQNYMDDNGHGTKVSGVIAATDNGAGVVGMAPRVSLIAVKIANMYGEVDPVGLRAAIRWSVDPQPLGGGAKIISMSLSSPFPDEALRSACAYAHTRGALLIAASGNDNHESIDYPARYRDEVVAVGAVFQSDPLDLNPPPRWVESPTNGSNYGPELNFVAPTKVNTTALGGGYAIIGGTSAAVPHVSGAAALIWSSPPEGGSWYNDKVEQKMRSTALDLGSSGRDSYFGYGLVNAWYACQRPPADITYDNVVYLEDAVFLQAHWWDGIVEGSQGFDRRADINRDNAANLYDAGLINANWLKHYP